MINDQRTIEIKASPDKVFKQIEINPFPTYGILNTKPFFFIRITLIDGIRTGIRLAFDKNLNREMTEPVELGSSLGPFILTEKERPSRYYFTLKSLFINCEAGFNLHSTGKGTLLSLEAIAKDPTFREKIWWFFIKPIHILLAHKVLKTIRKDFIGRSRSNHIPHSTVFSPPAVRPSARCRYMLSMFPSPYH